MAYCVPSGGRRVGPFVYWEMIRGRRGQADGGEGWGGCTFRIVLFRFLQFKQQNDSRTASGPTSMWQSNTIDLLLSSTPPLTHPPNKQTELSLDPVTGSRCSSGVVACQQAIRRGEERLLEAGVGWCEAGGGVKGQQPMACEERSEYLRDDCFSVCHPDWGGDGNFHRFVLWD